MKQFKLRRFFTGLTYFIILLYFEFIFRAFVGNPILDTSMLFVMLFSASLALFLSSINRLGNLRFNKIFFLVILFLLALLYSIQICVFKMFGLYFDWTLISASSQVASFASDGLVVILTNILGVMLFFLPFVLFTIYKRAVYIEKDSLKNTLIKFLASILIYIGLILSFNINKNKINSNYSLYYKVNNVSLNVKNFGVVESFLLDTKRAIFGFSEDIEIVEMEKEKEPLEDKYEYNNLDISFDELISSEKNPEVLKMHKYFASEDGTKKNRYTNFFKDKNLILFMAESFNEIAVRKDLTPTLYKLVNSGFVFEDFYTPTISSTIGGEFQELTGLVAASGFLSPWKSGNNAYPLGIANVFKDKGYSTFAYHDHSYTFQSRNNYLASLGFDNFKGCRNGLEKKINCNIWPESDVEMINATFDDYISSEKPFFTYYVSVSGHGDYGWAQSAMARKHKEDVSSLNYSEKPLAYLAAQMELDRALELLIKKLDDSGKLDDTVIALVGDHYPYYLSLDEVNEISSYKKDSVVEINHSNFILWNNKMEKVTIDKIGSQIDVLPTIYNLFGVPYDSRIIIGKDILSTEPGLAIFGNSSWVSDYGTYFSNSNKFVLKEGKEVTSDYVEKMNKIVANKVAMSKYIMVHDYYRKVLR